VPLASARRAPGGLAEPFLNDIMADDFPQRLPDGGELVDA